MYHNMFRLSMVISLLALFLLTACGNGDSTSGTNATATPTGPDRSVLDAKKAYTVDFWEAFSTGANKDVTESLINQYKQKNPNVTVNLQAFDSYPTLQTKLNAAIASKTPPALAQVYESWAVQYQQNDQIVPLQPYINGKNGLKDLNDFYPALLKDGQINGTQYMLPFNKSNEVLYYNADALQKLNMTPPTTWQALVDDVTKIGQAGNGNQWGLSFTPSVDEWSILYKALGGTDFVSKDGKSTTFDKGSNKTYAKNAMDYLAPLVKSGAAHVTQGYAWQNDFTSQKAVFSISTIASYPFLSKAINGAFKFDESALPAGPKGQYTVLFGTNLSIFKGVSEDNRTAAWDLLKFLTSKESNATFVKQTGYMPIRKSVFSSKELQDYYAQVPTRKVGPQMIEHSFVASIEPGWQKCRDDITSGYTSVLKGQSTSDDALTKMAQACNDDLNG